MIRYYEKMYDNAIKEIGRPENLTFPYSPEVKKSCRFFLFSSYFLVILTIAFPFLNQIIGKWSFLFGIVLLVFFILTIVSAFRLSKNSKEWHSEITIGKLTVHVKNCRDLQKELEKYKIKELSQYENMLSEMSNRKNEYIKKRDRIITFKLSSVLGGILSSFLGGKFTVSLESLVSSLLIYCILFACIIFLEDYYDKKLITIMTLYVIFK